ncbi:hypothetical protein BU23DRAFT_558006 [Bimuria novae-zelandiae CBS 107.79]|uniref:Uncharacterized protein n=1 Tax=Bimuria novae-zelandiae CBS 107.79 TaxID=1447943 RepID=A0A6A5V1Q6_9PLEO|nr:hypothetical protein BU23DRAFT_558006 [Bimuria novae-zelandiae CBS 107.79]
MAEVPKVKYDSLPGIDTAPDVYETTPDLAEDLSTIQASTAVSDSEDDDDDPETSAVRHQHLHTDQARSRFQPSRVDAHGVDFSDNISAQRRSYRTSTRARRRGEILGDDSDEEAESFERKLMRVKQELQELEGEYQERVKSGDMSKIEERDPKEIIEFISDKVDHIYAMRRGGVRGAEPQLDRTIDKFNSYAPFELSSRITKAIASQPPLPGSQVQRGQLEYVLDQAKQFDDRLSKLETSLGLNGNTMPDVGENGTLPIFTTLERIEQTIGLVGDASQGTLEAAGVQIKKMIVDAEQLKELREEASHDGESPNPEQEAKINALYGTLPSIDKLSPILPMMLERLRTLRLVHTSAWAADDVLTELENRQSQQEAEIKKWEQSMQELEEDVKKCERAMQSNMHTVGDWIKKIEERVAKLPGGDAGL